MATIMVVSEMLGCWHARCRRDRNRQTALATYYRRKARIAELQGTLTALRAEHAALETLADMAEASGDCAGAPVIVLLCSHLDAQHLLCWPLVMG